MDVRVQIVTLSICLVQIMFYRKFTGLDGAYGDTSSLDGSSGHAGARTLLKYSNDVSDSLGIWSWIIPSVRLARPSLLSSDSEINTLCYYLM